MALAIKSGALYDNADAWVDYYILDTDTPDVYKVYITNGVLQLQSVDMPEDNPLITDDDDPDVNYYLGVTSGVLHLVPGPGSAPITCPDLCSMITQQGDRLVDLILEVRQMRDVVAGIDVRTEDNNALLGGLEAAPAEWAIVG